MARRQVAANGIVRKPADPEVLMQVVEECIGAGPMGGPFFHVLALTALDELRCPRT